MGAVQSDGQPEQEGVPTDPAHREAGPTPPAVDGRPDGVAAEPVPAGSDAVPAAQNGAVPSGAAQNGAEQNRAPQDEAEQNGPEQNGAPQDEAAQYAAAPQYGAAAQYPASAPYPAPAQYPASAQYPGPGQYPVPGQYTAPAQYPAPVPPHGYAAAPPPYGSTPAPPPWPAAPFPPPPPQQQAPVQQVPGPGWPHPGAGGPHAGPSYPPGPYPPAEPYPAPSISRTGGPAATWGAPAPVRTHRWGLGAYLLAEAVFLLVGGIFQIYVMLSGAELNAGLLIVALAAPSVLAAGTGLLITRLRGNGPRIDLRLEWSWRDVGIGLAFGFGGLAVTIPASLAYVAIVGEDASSAVGDVFGGIRAGPALAIVVLLIVVIITPMCEEILYRGLLWGGVEKLSGRWVAFGVTTVLFALAHFELTRTPLLLIVSIPIALARLYTGKLLPSILAHQVNNLLPGIALAMGLLGVVPVA